MKVRVKVARMGGKRALFRAINEEKRLSRMSGTRLTPRRLVGALRERGYTIVESSLSLDHEEVGDSIDAQVDQYLAQYEGSAKKTQMESRSWRDDVRSFLTEAEDEEPSEEEPEQDVSTEPQKMTINDIDVESFANSIARLIENYDSLLEVRNTLLKRATNFVAKSYDDEVVKMLKTSLREQHGLVVGQSNKDKEEEFQAPPAAEAGPGGGV